MSKFFNELKRRHVIKSAVAYLVIAWLILQVGSFFLETFNSPDWVQQALTIFLIIGLPIWLVISWIYDLTPRGFEKTTDESDSPEDQLIAQVTSKRLNTFIIVSLSIAVVLLILRPSFFTSDSDKDYSIAVLPFDNIKVDDGNEWLSAGFTTDINSYLSKIKNLRVIDPYSADKYKDSKKNNLVIGEELGVSHLLKGSVRQLGNKLTIAVYLINIISDKTEWSDSFQESFEENPLKIQQEVSQRIVKELKIELTPQEEEELETYPTNSIEAQRLFSEGISYSDLVGVEYLERVPFLLPGGFSNLKKSVGLFEQAISLDPNYSEAYAEMAFSLQLMKANYKVVDSLIERSLEINPNTARAYTTKGAMQGYREGNWEKAKEYFQKAIELKPNDATNQLYFALYFASRAEPNYKKALEHINIAQKLNPHFDAINYDKIEYLLKNDKIVEAEAFYTDNNSFFTEGLKSKIQTRLFKSKAKKVSLEKKDWTEAVKFYDKEIENNPENPEIYRLLAEVYDEVLNDAPNFYKYAKLAYELDTALAFKLNVRKQFIFKRTFGFSQMKNKKWEENYKLALGIRHPGPLFAHNYFKGDYEKAQIYLEKYNYDNYDDQAILYAAQKKIKKTYEILNKGVLANYEKARVFAILEERDSMYYYINMEKNIYKIRYFNSYFEVDPYRKEERFKAFLKKNYLPLTHWNE